MCLLCIQQLCIHHCDIGHLKGSCHAMLFSRRSKYCFIQLFKKKCSTAAPTPPSNHWYVISLSCVLPMVWLTSVLLSVSPSIFPRHFLIEMIFFLGVNPRKYSERMRGPTWIGCDTGVRRFQRWKGITTIADGREGHSFTVVLPEQRTPLCFSSITSLCYRSV